MRWTKVALAAGLLLSLGTTAEAAERPQPSAASDVAGDNDPHWPVDARMQCAAYNAHAGAGDSIRWLGGCRDGKTSGPGTLTFFAHGRMFEQLTGTFDGGMVQDGHVTIVWADGSKYDGEERHGRFNGAGVLTTAEGGRYDGVWEDDSFKGPRVVAAATPPAATAMSAPVVPTPRPTAPVVATRRAAAATAPEPTPAPIVPTPKPLAPVAATRHAVAMAAHEATPAPPRPRTTVVSGASAVAADTSAVTAPVAAAPDTVAPPAPPAAAAQGSLADPATPTADEMPTGRWTFLGTYMDTNLIAVDGSTLTLGSADGGGLVRAIGRPDGSAQNVMFAFLGERLGTVRDPRAPDAVLATFRISDAAMDVAYADGHSEHIVANALRGILVTTTAPGGQVYETAWYPEGHSFSRADRDAAVAQFASRLAADTPVELPRTVAPPTAAPASTVSHAKPKKTHSSHSTHGQTASTSTDPAPTTGSPAMPALPPRVGASAMLASSEPIVVRTSEIHPIDPPDARHGASSCLTVESDGKHWGFRNGCDTDVQFVYCLLNGNNNLTDCAQGGVSGSVTANGFGALTADESLKDVAANHAFRWVACAGGAGEVVPRLDRADPPAGRCLRADDRGPQEANASNDDGN